MDKVRVWNYFTDSLKLMDDAKTLEEETIAHEQRCDHYIFIHNILPEYLLKFNYPLAAGLQTLHLLLLPLVLPHRPQPRKENPNQSLPINQKHPNRKKTHHKRRRRRKDEEFLPFFLVAMLIMPRLQSTTYLPMVAVAPVGPRRCQPPMGSQGYVA